MNSYEFPVVSMLPDSDAEAQCAGPSSETAAPAEGQSQRPSAKVFKSCDFCNGSGTAIDVIALKRVNCPDCKGEGGFMVSAADGPDTSAADSTTGPSSTAGEIIPIEPRIGPVISMTDAEKEAQRRSFAYGNVAIENPNVTREMVDEEAEKLSFRDVPWDLMSGRDFDAEAKDE